LFRFYGLKSLPKTLILSEIDRSHHYARDILLKMLADEPGQRISSSQIVNELKSIKINVK
jgi:hypothetical protein